MSEHFKYSNDAYVYSHTRIDTGEVFYIGIGVKKEFKRAYEHVKRSIHWNRVVGKTDFIVHILKSGITWEEACVVEIELISKFGRIDLNTGSLVNKTIGGDGIYGVLRTEEWNNKISLSNKGRIVSEESRIKTSKTLTGRKLTEETKKKLKGRVLSQEVRDRMSKSMENHFVSEETKIKIGISNTGKKRTEIQKENISKGHINHVAWNKGIKATDERKQKQRESMIGNIPWNKGIRTKPIKTEFKMTIEQRQNMSNARKKYWDDRRNAI